MGFKSGDTAAFDQNWRSRQEAYYNHWTRDRPRNQVQLAFRSHWEVFSELIGELAERKGRVLEVGCGRGSLSSYFAEDGWDCTLLDYSTSVLQTAREIFARNGHKASFVPGDANNLPFPDETFDVTCSIGLLEHFEDVRRVISEQVRVLRPGGWFLGYIVPERPDNLQRYFRWVNVVLKRIARLRRSGEAEVLQKTPIFRSDADSERYLDAMTDIPYRNLHVFGMYSMPMISHSPEFPFSLLPPSMEVGLTRTFQGALKIRRLITGRHGWVCSERMGQAFLLAFQKPSATDDHT